MVANSLALVGVPIHHDRGRVEISGAETANWGTGAAHQNSVVGALDAVCHLLHFPGIDYVALMGVSGHAFRIQVSEKGLCASSAHAMCGRKTGDRAFAAVPIEWGTIQAGLGGTAQAEDAVHIVLGVVDQGLPVLAMSEETDLVLGHVHDHLVARTYDGYEEGYSALSKWPWTFRIPERRRTPPPPCEQIKEGLRAAVDDWRAEEPTDGYWTGAAAYAAWRDKLREDAVSALANDARWQLQHGNAFVMECLIDARRTAAGFLTRVANALGPVGRPELLAAAEVYRRLHEEILGGEGLAAIAPYPWMSDQEHPWDEEVRSRQAARLIEAEAADAEAVGHLERALAECGGMAPAIH